MPGYTGGCAISKSMCYQQGKIEYLILNANLPNSGVRVKVFFCLLTDLLIPSNKKIDVTPGYGPRVT